MMVLPDLILQQVLAAAFQAIGGGFSALNVHLYTNNITPTKGSTFADFAEVTPLEVPGYLSAAWSWNDPPPKSPDGSWFAENIIQANYQANADPATPVTVFGWFADNFATPGVLVASGSFVVPFVFSSSGDGFVLGPSVRLNYSPGDGEGLISFSDPQPIL